MRADVVVEDSELEGDVEEAQADEGCCAAGRGLIGVREV